MRSQSRPAPTPGTSTGLDPKVAGLLAFLASIALGIAGFGL